MHLYSFVYFFLYLFLKLFIYLFIYLFILIFIYVDICIYLFIYLFMYLFIYIFGRCFQISRLRFHRSYFSNHFDQQIKTGLLFTNKSGLSGLQQI